MVLPLNHLGVWEFDGYEDQPPLGGRTAIWE